MIGLLMPILLCSVVSAVSHSLRYFYTAMSPIPGLPEIVAVGYVDDIPIDYYDSDLRKLIPRQQWIQECQSPEYWDEQTQILRSSEHVGQTNIQTALNRTNQSGGIHTVQVMHGCELRDDGQTSGFHQEGWDGQDYISFDKDHMVWVTPVAWGLITKNKWDENKARNQQRKAYLEGTCIEWLKKYLEQGKQHLESVTGFYPRDIEVILLRNGDDFMDTYSTGILPNHDGTYQLRRWAQINPKDGATYSCQYEQSEKEVETRVWDGMFRFRPGSRQGTNSRLDVGIVAVVALITVVIGAIVWKKTGVERKSAYRPANCGESSSNSSSQA
ncbi:H-2 class I histocompatibility antigen, Q9 alpha chain-like isoform X3 [Scyliorhinus canicula]|uniref:H-2 class I histocompatibility antigen, Q9 alpha chain-like isoform X3 n=1 Tax=Scyliorhinus canicula TaxID=7830 RepID=UPI0018F7AAF6|nr:H-2 class I histocompatibility antigen, Q9 alpha chain-like isoform X3 [Scyliorhinus canicula]